MPYKHRRPDAGSSGGKAPLGLAVTVNPNHLRFEVCLGEQSVSSLTLTSISPHRVGFKVKTTDPSRYCVQPNVSVLEPGTSVQVDVTLRDFDEYPDDIARCRDKFQIIGVVLDDPTLASLPITQVLSSVSNGQILEQKIRVYLTRPPVTEPSTTSTVHSAARTSPLLNATPSEQTHPNLQNETDLAHGKRAGKNGPPTAGTALLVSSPRSDQSGVDIHCPVGASRRKAMDTPPISPFLSIQSQKSSVSSNATKKPSNGSVSGAKLPLLGSQERQQSIHAQTVQRVEKLVEVEGNMNKKGTEGKEEADKKGTEKEKLTTNKSKSEKVDNANAEEPETVSDRKETEERETEREKAERELAEREKAERERAERERAERERAERERAERERAEKARQALRASVISPAVAPVPPVVHLSREEQHRSAIERAELLARALRARNTTVEELKHRLAEERSRLNDARLAVVPAYDVKYEIDENARIPLPAVGLMALISITIFTLLV